MKILVNDHAGHPFQVQLSRALAQRGYNVLHTYCANLQTPRGKLALLNSDPTSLEIRGVTLSSEFSRYSPVKRFFQEKELGKKLVQQVVRFSPDVVISANTPLGAQAQLLKLCKERMIKFIFWVQDLLGVGIRQNLSKRLGLLGSIIGRYYQYLEISLLRTSEEVIVITEDFATLLSRNGIKRKKIEVIHNWAPLEDVPIFPKRNAWSMKHGLDDKRVFLYSGTLGMKHNPELLWKLAEHFLNQEDVRIVVLSEGLGAQYLREKQQKESELKNLIVMGFQPFETLAMALASADVLMAILDQDPGVFAVPSKVLTYLCAERPLLLSVPPENFAARIVREHEAGFVVSPGDTEAFISASDELMQDEGIRNKFAKNGREYAENTFDIEEIADRFETIIHR